MTGIRLNDKRWCSGTRASRPGMLAQRIRVVSTLGTTGSMAISAHNQRSAPWGPSLRLSGAPSGIWTLDSTGAIGEPWGPVTSPLPYETSTPLLASLCPLYRVPLSPNLKLWLFYLLSGCFRNVLTHHIQGSNQVARSSFNGLSHIPSLSFCIDSGHAPGTESWSLSLTSPLHPSDLTAPSSQARYSITNSTQEIFLDNNPMAVFIGSKRELKCFSFSFFFFKM